MSGSETVSKDSIKQFQNQNKGIQLFNDKSFELLKL